jgi:hypothetical protein
MTAPYRGIDRSEKQRAVNPPAAKDGTPGFSPWLADSLTGRLADYLTATNQGLYNFEYASAHPNRQAATRPTVNGSLGVRDRRNLEATLEAI